MKRKKIIWLCSWYPNKYDAFDGDFIQRHARAAALYNDIFVIHVRAGTENDSLKTEDVTSKEGLTEKIVYYKPSKSILAKFINHYRYIHFFKTAVRKYIIETGKPDLVHVHVPVKAGIVAQWIKKVYKIPFIVSEHWWIYNDLVNENYRKRNLFFKRATEKTIDGASVFLSVSKFLGDAVNKFVLPKQYQIIPNAVNNDLFFFEEKDNKVFRFIHVSNMVPLKNVDSVLQAAYELYKSGYSFEFVLIGNKDNAYPVYAEKLGLPADAVKFLGEIPYTNVAGELQKSNSFVINCKTETFCCAAAEALCCGLPVIAADAGALPELVNGENGMLVKTDKVEELKDAMKKMIDNYAAFNRKKIAEDAKSKFNYSIVGKKFDDVYAVVSAENLKLKI
jgi:glycosyltransferase involved in cell wall biosynthesis